MQAAEKIGSDGSLRATWEYEWVSTPARLAEIVPQLQAEELLTVDTETVDWQTGNERLCLIQIGIPRIKFVYVVDVLGVGDLRVLEPMLRDAKPELIAHNAPFEARQFERYGLKMRGIIDTLVMARKLRPDLPNHTLRTCCKLLLGIELEKEEQTSDWSQRPLTDSQLNYARLDAEVVYAVYQELAALEERLKIEPGLAVPDLMEELAAAARRRIELTHAIATDLAYLAAREELLKAQIRARLIEGEPAYKGEWGSASVSRVRRTEINPVLVRTEFPELAPLVITEHVERDRIKAVLEEHGFDEKALEKVLVVTGYQDRLSLSLKNVV